MNNTCAGPCVHDVSSKRSGINSSELDACVSKVLDKLQSIRNSTNGNTRVGFYQGGTLTSAFSDFHSSRVTKRMRAANRVLEILRPALRVEKLDQIRKVILSGEHSE